jgi:hypothetical protein
MGVVRRPERQRNRAGRRGDACGPGRRGIRAAARRRPSIVNTGTEDFIFYVIADNSPADSTYYPNSKKWQMKPQRKLFRMTEVDYFDGEE